MAPRNAAQCQVKTSLSFITSYKIRGQRGDRGPPSMVALLIRPRERGDEGRGKKGRARREEQDTYSLPQQ
eukprot:6978944-Heterocapsa_arctica.AAC.1